MVTECPVITMTMIKREKPVNNNLCRSSIFDITEYLIHKIALKNVNTAKIRVASPRA